MMMGKFSDDWAGWRVVFVIHSYTTVGSQVYPDLYSIRVDLTLQYNYQQQS